MANIFGALVWQRWPAALPICTPYSQTLRGLGSSVPPRQLGVDNKKQAEGVGRGLKLAGTHLLPLFTPPPLTWYVDMLVCEVILEDDGAKR